MEAPLYAFVTVDVLLDDSVALIKYNRPQSGNSLHPKMLAEIVSALKWVEGQPGIRIIIQTGEGLFFSTGMELLDGGDMSFEKGSDFHELNKILILSEKILIAAVNGPAVGYGVSSLGLFDLVYSVPHAYFFTPFVKWGMAAEGASSISFPRLMGHQKAASLFLAADRITAQEAERLGLISKILPNDTFMEDIIQIAKKIVAQPPGSLRATKELMRLPIRQDLLDANDRECSLISKERFGFEEYQESIAKFKIEQEAKRKLRSKI